MPVDGLIPEIGHGDAHEERAAERLDAVEGEDADHDIAQALDVALGEDSDVLEVWKTMKILVRTRHKLYIGIVPHSVYIGGQRSHPHA